MKVLLVDSVPISFGGGYETFLTSLHESLDNAGVASTIVVPGDVWGSVYFSVLSGRPHRFRSDPRSSQPRSLVALRSEIRAADVVYVKNEPHELACVLLLSGGRTPVVVGMHSAISTEHGPRRLYESAAYGALLRRADGVHALQRARADWCVARHGVDAAKIEVFPTSIDTNAFPFVDRTNDGPLKLLFVGRLDAYKGVGEIVGAMEVLRAEHPGICELTIVGDGALREEVVDAARNQDITYLGRRDDIADICARHDALLAPFKMDTFALVPLEAMATGMPAIVSDIDEMKVVAGKSNVTVRSGSVDDLVEVVRRWADERMTSPAQWSARGATARRTVEESFSRPVVHGGLTKWMKSIASSTSSVPPRRGVVQA